MDVLKGTWCSGITSASHAEGPGLKSQCVHLFILRSLRAIIAKIIALAGDKEAETRGHTEVIRTCFRTCTMVM